MRFDKSEKRFERDIESYLINNSGYTQFYGQDENGKWVRSKSHDEDKCIFLDVLVEFIENTQPKEWAKYKKYYGENAPQKLYRRLENCINTHGLLYVLKNGIEDMGCRLRMCYFKPDSDLNADLIEKYNANILGCSRQFKYNPNLDNTIDMVLSLNGIPIVAIELKNQLTGQTYENAISQFKRNRNHKDFCFRFNHRFLVYFAVDLYEVWMSTQLLGDNTYFMPFNMGSNGAGLPGGQGNPENKDGYSTSYLWERVLQRDSLLDIINRFLTIQKSKITGKETLIFPRFHQYDVVHKVISDVRKKGCGHNYLIEHSAGSGKSNSIAWIAYRLASLHDDDNQAIFNSVIVVTNRIVLDNNLQETINSFEHVAGLVETIDSSKRSKNLAEAINDKKRIIVCTIQKFLFAYKDIEKMSDRRFAIIVDEAHQGQSGESAKSLRSSLIDYKQAIKEYADIEGIAEEEVDLDSDFVLKVIGQGKHKNQSFFAFTATPKKETLEVFGTYNQLLDIYEPFHVYSMRQAIEERYILDVLENYRTYKEAFRIIKVSKDDPTVFEKDASKQLLRYYKENVKTIEDKVKIIMDSFLKRGRYTIDGKGKAMIVADGRKNAVRYFLEIKEYINKNKNECDDCNVLVAFSGHATVDNKKYSESDLNIDEKGNSINTDKKFRSAFHSNKYNIMVVANKYQTGFDEPFLQSMYVDKKLSGVNAVQTLSRLNRTCKDKNDTFVLDFVNTSDAIKESFQPYYESTILEGSYDKNKIYDYRKLIHDYRLYDNDDVNEYIHLMEQNSKNKQSSTALGKLSSLLKPIVEKYDELDEDNRIAFRGFVSSFNKAYTYVTQLISLHDEQLFNEFLFTSNLIKFLKPNYYMIINIDDKVKLEYASLKMTFDGSIVLEKKSDSFKPDNKIHVKVSDKKKNTLQSIIDKINDRYGDNFTPGDRLIIEGVYRKLVSDPDIKKYKKYALDNTTQVFVDGLFPEKYKQVVTDCYAESYESYKKLFEDTEFYNTVMQAMANELYKEFRKSK